MTDKLTITKEELSQIIDSALKRYTHETPSKQTQEVMDKFSRALFGEDGESGLVKQHDEMYEFFINGKGGVASLKWLIWIFGAWAVLKTAGISLISK